MRMLSKVISAVILCYVHLSTIVAQPVNKQDSLILVAIYHATDGRLWRQNTNWLSGPVPTWHGVELTNGRVTTLALTNNNLSGQVPPVLGKLDALIRLYLSNNRLTGKIPFELSRLSNLEALDLSGNQLTGHIPSALARLSNLRELYLPRNQLTGRIPSALGNMKNLETIFLSFNPIYGRIPARLRRLSTLGRLIITDTRISGRIPAFIGYYPKLNTLSLSNNRLRGRIPSSLSRLIHVSAIELQHNALTGKIPSHLDQMDNLFDLDLSFNKLSGHIPSNLGHAPNLQRLFLSYNRLTGRIPPSLGAAANLYEIRVDNNQLSGPLPASLADPFIKDLWLNGNRLNFAGMEKIADSVQRYIFYPQANVPIKKRGNMLSVDVGGTPANNSYTWYRNMEVVATTNEPFYNAIISGSYFVWATNARINGLLVSDPVYVTVPADTIPGLKPIPTLPKEQPFFILSPNPAVKDIYIRLLLDKHSPWLDITITDMNRRVVLHKRQAAMKGQSFMMVDIQGLDNGMYVLTVRSGEQLGSKQFLILH
ncbi:T9SS type A sorting domain-containing protein [Chitinophaga agrisoli]|uniref:T9SS type A sorting domain-containing protein n=1 Tax=Chitinophaga agrisoli TaxID=2607653 RepID=A0A5B2VR74_9BACT|nr:leucine-rich repeat domain-containing protein [Chitinophaga agrisoli]KAA2241304.1 T9SS type A sorting domain-containing protein [Chitinophaga agrisoli]